MSGDGLAAFIVGEMCNTYDEDATDEVQLLEAHRVMDNAMCEILDVKDAFKDALENLGKKGPDTPAG
jgi:Mg2+/Co2+ transporter CorC